MTLDDYKQLPRRDRFALQKELGDWISYLNDGHEGQSGPSASPRAMRKAGL